MCQVLASFEDCRLDCIGKVEYLSNFVLFKTWCCIYISTEKWQITLLANQAGHQNRKTPIVLVYASQHLTLMDMVNRN